MTETMVGIGNTVGNEKDVGRAQDRVTGETGHGTAGIGIHDRLGGPGMTGIDGTMAEIDIRNVIKGDLRLRSIPAWQVCCMACMACTHGAHHAA